MRDDIIILPEPPSSCQNWLNKKINVDSGNHYNNSNGNYNKYYLDPEIDQDVKSSKVLNNHMINLVNCFKKCNEIFDDDDDDDAEIKNNLMELDKYIERYYFDNTKIEILLKPNSNRYHVNQLFKSIIDHVHDNQLEINFDKSVKDKFYQFCFKFSKHI